MDREWQGWNVIRVIPTGRSVPEATLHWLMGLASQKIIPLIICELLLEDGGFIGTKYTGYGPPDFVHEVKNGVNFDDILRF